MDTRLIGPALFLGSSLLVRGAAMSRMKSMKYSRIAAPVAKKVAETIYFGKHPAKPDEYRGDKAMDPPLERVDYYNWMRDETRSKDEVLNHIREENRYCEQMTECLAPLKDSLYNEMLGYLKQTDDEVPYRHGPYMYYTRTEEGLAYRLHCRVLSSDKEKGKEEVFLDENEVAKGHDYCVVGACEPSPSHMLLAYAVDNIGYETYTIRVCDLRAGAGHSAGSVIDTLTECSGDVVWGGDDSTLFYTKMDEEHRPHEVWMHVLGTSQDSDVLLYREDNQLFCVDVNKTSSEEYLIISSESIETSEEHIVSIAGVVGGNGHRKAVGELRTVQPRVEKLRYSCDHHGDFFYIVTNFQGAHNSKLCRIPTSSPSLTTDRWEEMCPYNPNVEVRYVLPFKTAMVVFGREGGGQRCWVLSAEGRNIPLGAEWKELPLAEEMYSISAYGNMEYDTQELRLKYSSLLTPQQVLSVNMISGDRKVLKEKEVPGYEREKYAVARMYAPSSKTSGCNIPISMVFSRSVLSENSGLPQDTPVLMYGYGSYGSSMDPNFDYTRLPLLDRGVVYAIAHIRGGGEMGRYPWYEAGGKYFTKMNTFHDFADCAMHLINQGVTEASRLAVVGRSAGGLLIGASVNMYPNLFRAAVADVPFVDVLNTMSDPTIPLTVGEWEEWGNPNEKDYFDYMKKFCPYSNVAPQDYPALLVTAGLHDPRVAYWEPAKWVAKLRELKTNDNQLLMKTDLSAGHFSASDRYKDLKERAFEMSWVLSQITADKN